MIEIRVLRNDQLRGWTIVIVHIFTLTLIANSKQGMHLTLGVGASKFEMTFGISLWNRWLIP